MPADNSESPRQFISVSSETLTKVPKAILAGSIGYMVFALYTNDNLFLIRDVLNLANSTLGTP